MTTLMSLLSVTGLVLLLLTAAPTSCYKLTPGSHLPPFSSREVKGEDTSTPGVVIDNAVDVKAEGFIEKDTKADELIESALKDDVLQILKSTGLNADNHDGLPPFQSVERGSKVTSSRAARRRRNVNRFRAFHATFTPIGTNHHGQNYIHHYSKYGNIETAHRDFRSLLCRDCPGDFGWYRQSPISFHRDNLGNGLIQIRPSGNNLMQYHYNDYY